MYYNNYTRFSSQSKVDTAFTCNSGICIFVLFLKLNIEAQHMTLLCLVGKSYAGL